MSSMDWSASAGWGQGGVPEAGSRGVGVDYKEVKESGGGVAQGEEEEGSYNRGVGGRAE